MCALGMVLFSDIDIYIYIVKHEFVCHSKPRHFFVDVITFYLCLVHCTFFTGIIQMFAVILLQKGQFPQSYRLVSVVNHLGETSGLGKFFLCLFLFVFC